MECATHQGTAAVASCTRCDRPMCDPCRQTLDGHAYCARCVEDLKAKLAPKPDDNGTPAEPAAIPITPDAGLPAKAVVFAIAAGIVGALIWYGIVELTNYKLGLVAVGIGWLVGIAAVFGAGGRGGTKLAALSLTVGLAAMLLGEYLIVNTGVHSYFAKERPDDSLPGFIPVGTFWKVYVETFSPLDLVFYAIGAWEAWRQPAKAGTRPAATA